MTTMQQISQKKAELEARVRQPGYKTTARDAAEAVELVNQYMDELARLEVNLKPGRGTTANAAAEQVLKVWYP